MDSAPITVAIIRQVRPGCEAAFEAALHDFIARSLQEPGQLGIHVLRPAPGSDSREYGLLRRFADAAARDAFYNSALYHEWQATVAPLVEGQPRYENLSGLETWFTLPGQRAMVPPPRWKMALVTLIGVYPMSLLWPWLLHGVVGDWPLLLRGLVISAAIVLSLTWVVMPSLTRVLASWLHPHRKTS
jgi:antibiotic biosynthesis monooxygenase (ABM) superfamily enzyme